MIALAKGLALRLRSADMLFDSARERRKVEESGLPRLVHTQEIAAVQIRHPLPNWLDGVMVARWLENPEVSVRFRVGPPRIAAWLGAVFAS